MEDAATEPDPLSFHVFSESLLLDPELLSEDEPEPLSFELEPLSDDDPEPLSDDDPELLSLELEPLSDDDPELLSEDELPYFAVYFSSAAAACCSPRPHCGDRREQCLPQPVHTRLPRYSSSEGVEVSSYEYELPFVFVSE